MQNTQFSERHSLKRKNFEDGFQRVVIILAPYSLVLTKQQ